MCSAASPPTGSPSTATTPDDRLGRDLSIMCALTAGQVSEGAEQVIDRTGGLYSAGHSLAGHPAAWGAVGYLRAVRSWLAGAGRAQSAGAALDRTRASVGASLTGAVITVIQAPSQASGPATAARVRLAPLESPVRVAASRRAARCYGPKEFAAHSDRLDVAETDRLMPHPVPAMPGWASVVNPGSAIAGEVTRLVAQAPLPQRRPRASQQPAPVAERDPRAPCLRPPSGRLPAAA